MTGFKDFSLRPPNNMTVIDDTSFGVYRSDFQYKDESLRFFRACVGDELYDKAMSSEAGRAHHYVVVRAFLSQADWEKFVWIEQHGSLEGFPGISVSMEISTGKKRVNDWHDKKREDRRTVMRYGMYTLNRWDLENFKDSLPEYVLSNCGKTGIFVLGATDEDRKIIGMAQFFVRMLPGNDPIADIVYVYVADGYRGNGLASRMINEIHKLMKKSGGEKCLALLKKKQKEQHLFERNGYLFMKSKDDMIGYLEDVHEDLGSGHLEQGVYYINR